jgi:hypothetical protein
MALKLIDGEKREGKRVLMNHAVSPVKIQGRVFKNGEILSYQKDSLTIAFDCS